MVVDTGPQVDIGRVTTPVMVLLLDEMSLCVATVDLRNAGSDRPMALLNSELDGCVVEESVLVLVAAEATPLAVVGTVTARASVLPYVGSKLPADSDGAAVVCTALLDAVVDDALDVVGLHVGQLWFRTEPEDVLPVMLDEHSLMCVLVWPDVIPANQDFMSADVCGDD